MKIKFSDQRLVQAFTLSEGVGQEEFDLPELAAGDAILLRDILVALDAASAGPLGAGSGLTLFAMAAAGKEQVSPSDLLDLERLLWAKMTSYGATAGSGIWVNNQFSQQEHESTGPRFPQVPTRGLFMFHHTINITDASTTIVKAYLMYDVVTLTGPEQLAYLL